MRKDQQLQLPPLPDVSSLSREEARPGWQSEAGGQEERGPGAKPGKDFKTKKGSKQPREGGLGRDCGMQLGKAPGDPTGGKGRCPNTYAIVSMRKSALDTSVEDEVSLEHSPEVP